MMVKAISSYMAFGSKKEGGSGVEFRPGKKITSSRAIMTKPSRISWFSSSDSPPLAKRPDAADLILHYFNIRSDYKGLALWSQKILDLKTPNPTLPSSSPNVHSKAQLRRLDEQVKTQKGYDITSQGKSYLQRFEYQ